MKKVLTRPAKSAVARFTFALFVALFFSVTARATVITITSQQTGPVWQYNDSAPHLRIYASQSFYTSDNTPVPGGVVGSPGWYRDIACTANLTTHVVTIPSFTVDSTVDSSVPAVVYTAVFFDSKGGRHEAFMSAFKVPVAMGAIVSWADLDRYNNLHIRPPDDDYYTKNQTDARISAQNWLSAGDPRLPTQAQKDAMAGTSGTPSSSNKFVTDADTTPLALAGGVVRRDANGAAAVNDKGSQFFNVKAYGAKCDRSGQAGTDDTTAVRNAITDAQNAPGRGIVLIPGPCLVRALSGTQVLLVTKSIELRGVGPAFSGLYAATDTPTNIPIIRYQPAAHPDNEGFTMRDLAVGSVYAVPNVAQLGAWTVTGSSGAEDLLLDDSLAPAGAPIRSILLEHVWFLPTTATPGTYAIRATNSTNTNGNPAQSTFRDCFIMNGVSIPTGGDTIRFRDNFFQYKNEALNISLVAGATGPYITGGNITNRGGVRIGRAVRGVLDSCIIEMAEPDTTGSDGAVVDLSGSPAAVDGFTVSNCVVSSLPGSPALDGIRVAGAPDQVDIANDHISVQGGKNNIVQTSTGIILETTTKFYGASTAISAATPANWFRAVLASYRGARAALDNTDTAQFNQLQFTVNGLQVGAVNMIGSLFATTTRRNNLEIYNSTATGSVDIFTNDGTLVFRVKSDGTIQVNDSGTMKTVTFGAADSGGAGTKVLRINN